MKNSGAPRRLLAIFIMLGSSCLAATALAQSSAPASRSRPDSSVIARIREEGLSRSQVMQTLDYLCNVIGQRLTGSPNCRQANEWTRKQLESWGLEDAHLEPWGPFGRGWAVKRFSVQVVEPYTIPLNGCPRAWTPGFDKPFEADVVYLDAKKDEDLEKYKGKLKGTIVLVGPVRDLQARWDPLSLRVTDSDLLKLADAEPGATSPPGQARAATPAERQAMLADTPAGRALLNRATTRPFGRGGPGGSLFAGRLLNFAFQQGAALVIGPSTQGDGGTIFVASAVIPGQGARGGGGFGPNAPHVYSVDPPPIPAQVTLAVEDYNRLVRMIQLGQKLRMAVDLRVQFYDEDRMAYNTIAEIPGSDLKDQIVMVGGHLDSWQSGTGATDNGAGVAAGMEAVRIIEALGLHPRRTIRIGLWTGEEEGLLGSRAYVTKHFGYYPDGGGARRGGGRRGQIAGGDASSGPTTRPARALVRADEYERLSVYFNLDNGSGKIRGIYMQGNEGARPLFRSWLAPFADLGADTLTPSNTGSTDHVPFDAIGLPAFQFIQDPIEYWSRTHHSNEDVYDRIQAEDMKQASTIMAAFIYNAAMMDDRFPRKPLR